MSIASAAATAADGVGRSADRLLERPRVVIGSLVGLQLVATLVFALSIERNGWVFFQGGDQIWLATQGWLLGQFELPPTELGYLWSFVLMPIMWVTGPTYVEALPPLTMIQVLVLGPVALLCVYDLACRIGGRLLGYWASFLWVITPFAAIPLFVDRYQERFGEQFLPQALGLTAMSDYPSMVLCLAAAVFVVRSVDAARVADALLAGLLLGAAGAMKPPNLLLGVGAALAYLVARRWREGVVFGLAIVPSLLVLAYWKDRGLGGVPVLSLEEVRVAAGSTLAISVDLDRYLEINFDHWLSQMDELREFFWSARVAQWLPVAGLVAVLRVRRWPVAALLLGWLAAFLVVKGFSPRATIESGSFWRLLMPAWPAYLLLFASIPLLVPTLARRLGERLRAPTPRTVAPRWIVAAAVLSLLVPATVIAASSPLEEPELALTQDDGGNFILTSVDASVNLRVESSAEGTRLTWDDPVSRANVFYRVYRAAGDDTKCENTDGHPAQSCYLRGGVPIADTRELEYIDAEAPAGATYRIGVGANWVDDPAFGDVFTFSRPAVAPAG
ncbi:MAG TPA: hypothetical protein VMK83_11595 [Gaiellaceae bacterium]|nr:hypothetical protein [Gaiellaceae bacterium]